MSKKIRLEDLAVLSGVSIATVSRALNDSPAVNEQTKREIWKLARKHGYTQRPNMPMSLDRAAATISIIIPPPQGRDSLLVDPFFREIIGAIGDSARERRCDLVTSYTSPQNYDDLTRALDRSQSEGAIILGQSFLHERLNRLAGNDTKFIVWGGELPGQQYCSVGTDNLKGGRRATSHLARLGRNRIVFMGDPEGPEIAQRLEGYKTALERSGLEYDDALVVPTHFQVESAEASVDVLLSKRVEFDGIFASSDTIALGAIRALQHRGVSVPEDVSVVGYDDIQFAQYSRPSLTTIRQDLVKAGNLMVSKLLNAETSRDMRSERLPTDVVVRESCGA